MLQYGFPEFLSPFFHAHMSSEDGRMLCWLADLHMHAIRENNPEFFGRVRLSTLVEGFRVNAIVPFGTLFDGFSVPVLPHVGIYVHRLVLRMLSFVSCA